MEQKHTDSSTLKWEITPAERRKRVRKLIFIAWFPLFILGVLASTITYPASFTYDLLLRGLPYVLKNALWTVAWVMLSTVILLIVNQFFPHKTRTYVLNNETISISRGRKGKTYSWEDFEYFYPYSKRYRTNLYKGLDNIDPHKIGENQREKMFSAERDTTGELFYLKRKPEGFISKLFKVFVIVYSEPDNNTQVVNFLSRHLERKDMKSTSDLGMVFYEFK